MQHIVICCSVESLLRSPNIAGIKDRETATSDRKVEIILYCWGKAGM